jgi:hypothetical protein
MKAIYSYWDPSRKRKITPETIKLAAISNFFAKKQKFETYIYTESFFVKNFFRMGFDNLEVLLQPELEKIPKTVWSGCKILAMSKQSKPFLHLDFDFFMYSRRYESLKEIKNSKMLFYHYDEADIEAMKKAVKFLFDNTDESLSIDIESLSLYPKNFSMFGTYFYSQVETLQRAAKEMLIYLQTHKEFYESSELIEYMKHLGFNTNFIIPVIVEQVFLPVLMTRNLRPENIGSFCDLTKNEFLFKNKKVQYTRHLQTSGRAELLANLDHIIKHYGLKY